jgi:hypothetical protein
VCFDKFGEFPSRLASSWGPSLMEEEKSLSRATGPPGSRMVFGLRAGKRSWPQVATRPATDADALGGSRLCASLFADSAVKLRNTLSALQF